MPTYVYECEKCKKIFETIHTINLNPVCHLELENESIVGEDGQNTYCNGNIKRIIQPTPIIFKGKGWTPKHFK